MVIRDEGRAETKAQDEGTCFELFPKDKANTGSAWSCPPPPVRTSPQHPAPWYLLVKRRLG